MSRRTAWAIIKKRAENVGLKEIRTHSARTTFITEAVKKFPYEVVAATVGHANVKTTQSYDKRESDYRKSATYGVGF